MGPIATIHAVPPKPLQRQFQFSLRMLLAAVGAFAVGFAGLRYGVGVLCAFGIPSALLGYQIIASPQWIGKVRVKMGCPQVSLPLSCTALAFFVLVAYGMPIDTVTWLTLIGGVAWSTLFWVALSGRLAWWLGAIPMCFFLSLLYPPDLVGLSYTLQDVRGGRAGVLIAPGLRFARPGANAPLLRKYLGSLEPKWMHLYPISSRVRDGDERVNSASIIRRPDLREILALLPSDAERARVLECATDPENLLRVHQGLLLVCVKTLGYPPGYDAKTWWEKHAALFRREYDADKAIKTIWGWRTRIEQSISEDGHSEIRRQLRAARDQEEGSWGGDLAMSEAAEAILKTQGVYVAYDPPPNWPGLGVEQVAWWPPARKR